MHSQGLWGVHGGSSLVDNYHGGSSLVDEYCGGGSLVDEYLGGSSLVDGNHGGSNLVDDNHDGSSLADEDHGGGSVVDYEPPPLFQVPQVREKHRKNPGGGGTNHQLHSSPWAARPRGRSRLGGPVSRQGLHSQNNSNTTNINIYYTNSQKE